MVGSLCPNVYLDTSSSNSWMRYTPGLSLPQVFATAKQVIGIERLLFGTDSSFFPRGWNREVFETQLAAMTDAGFDDAARALVFGGNFARLLPG